MGLWRVTEHVECIVVVIFRAAFLLEWMPQTCLIVMMEILMEGEISVFHVSINSGTKVNQ